MAGKVFPRSQKLIRVGWVGTGPFSFYGHYIRVINNIYREYNFLNMRVTHIWGETYERNFRGSDRFVKNMLGYWSGSEQSPEGIARMCNIPNVCSDYHDMTGQVDAAMIMDFDRSFSLAEPFLNRGIPIFICTPVAVNVTECEKILNLAEKNGAAVYSGTFTADIHDNQNLSKRVKRDNISSFFASTKFEYFTSYANDGLEPIRRLIGPGVKKVSLHGWDGSRGYDPEGIPVSHIMLEYESRNGKPPIQGILTLGGFKSEKEWYKVYYDDHTTLEGITDWGSTDVSNNELAFRDFLINLQEVFVTNKSLETRQDILEKLKVVIAAYKSANEGGRAVRLDEVGDFRLPTVRIEKWNEIPD
ncbi:MAG: Gfo/Idh/MocA family oxidoreductase [Candidatus Latescibacterota bacterium]